MALMSAATANGDLALVGGTIFTSPEAKPIRNGVVIIRDGRIAAAGSRTRVRVRRSMEKLDCSGMTIVAGFWNSHVHFFQRKWADAGAIPAPELERQLEEMLTRYGFTSAFDLGSSWENTRIIRDRIASGEIKGPRIRSTGPAMLPQGSAPPELVLTVLGLMKTPLYEIADVDQAAALSTKALEEGVDGIKLFASAPPAFLLPENVFQAAVRAAHRKRKPAFTHPGTVTGLLQAVRGGVDVVAHTTPQTGPWEAATIAAMKERNVALTPTLQVWKYNARHDRISTQEKLVDTAIGQLRLWVASGGTVLFGTDAGYVDYDPSEEYALMARAGMNFRQILASLTTAPAERFGESSRLGRIAEGFEADLVVLDGDPSRDLRALSDVRYTLRAGRIIHRANE
jgi:imidazolonepropionase-like amidohydrolase